MKVGFTGTQFGMTVEQKLALLKFISTNRDITEFHHGDCIGADYESHILASVRKRIRIVIHPPEDPRKRANCRGRLLPPLPYLERNKAIVNNTDVLIAAPRGPEVLRSGTWSTVRYARKAGKKVIILP